MQFVRWVVFGLFSVVMVFASAGPVSAQVEGAAKCGPEINTSPSSIDLGSQADRVREAVRCLINAEREAMGLRPLWLSPELTRAAQEHAADAGRLRWWDGEYEAMMNPVTGGVVTYDTHVNPETNSTPQTRIVANGYCQRQPLKTGEITYTGTGSDPTLVNCPLNACSTPVAAVNWWMNVSTAGHRQRVLDPAVRQIGVGLSGNGADPHTPLGGDMGTYVVDFGDCQSFVPPTQEPVVQTNPGFIVGFEKLHINDCPEIGICDWKLSCSVAGQGAVELIGMREANTGDDIVLSAAALRNRTLPVDLTCRVSERDGPGFFDSAVWEHVGTVTQSVNIGENRIRINQRPSEGDVTVHVSAEALGSISTPFTEEEPRPAAPRNCRTTSAPICGGINIECDRPMPYFDISVSGGGGGGIPVYMTNREIGFIGATYQSEGRFTLKVCAHNTAGTSCGREFPVDLGPVGGPDCFGPPPPPPACAPGFYLCPTRGCIPVGRHCDIIR
ncbi:MAG: CAP domain-containing protein [Phyllobacterium sp.]|uniref:CAP domain-containing protein n=1 Tax=Phyllobacterium sp. TaxID=1871046 RepID=UPI0030F28CFE